MDRERLVDISCHTVGEFDAHWLVWILNPDDLDDRIDVIFEGDTYSECITFCEQNRYTIMNDITKTKDADYYLVEIETDIIMDMIDEVTDGMLSRKKTVQSINEAKRRLNMRKDPRHESWMEER